MDPIERIRDFFLAWAKESGCRVEVLPQPPRGYAFWADVYAESTRLGRFATRKNSASWKPAGGGRVVQLNGEDDVREVLLHLVVGGSEPSSPGRPTSEVPGSPPEPEQVARDARGVDREPPAPETPVPPEPTRAPAEPPPAVIAEPGRETTEEAEPPVVGTDVVAGEPAPAVITEPGRETTEEAEPPVVGTDGVAGEPAPVGITEPGRETTEEAEPPVVGTDVVAGEPAPAVIAEPGRETTEGAEPPVVGTDVVAGEPAPAVIAEPGRETTEGAEPPAREGDAIIPTPALPLPRSAGEVTVSHLVEGGEVAPTIQAPRAGAGRAHPDHPPVAKPTSSLSRAMSAFKEGDFARASQWAKLALAENPESPTAKDILARSQRLVEGQRAAHGEEHQEPPEGTVPGAGFLTQSGSAPVPPPVEARPAPPPSPVTPLPPPSRLPAPALPTAPPPPSRPPAPRPPRATTTPPARKRRVSPWVLAAFLVVAGVLWISRPRTAGNERAPQYAAPAPIDTLAEMREQVKVVLAEIEADTLGLPHESAMILILGILERSPSDSAAVANLRTLSARADSLGTILLRTTRFADASIHLTHAHRGWAALRSVFPADSSLMLCSERNQLQSEILETKRAMFVDMVPVASGPFRRGSTRGGLNARPERELQISAFFIDKTEVTNRQYRAFILDTGASPPGGSPSRAGWQGAEYPEGTSDLPVVLVTWDEAVRFAAWAGKRLPTEAEWEKAARGSDGRFYPWGDNYDANLVVGRGSGAPKPVGGVPSGASPYGAVDMAGNVREWTADYYDPDYFSRAAGEDPKGPPRGRERVVRGGSWRRDCEVEGLTHFRAHETPATRADDLGFRLAVSDSAYPADVR